MTFLLKYAGEEREKDALRQAVYGMRRHVGVYVGRETYIYACISALFETTTTVRVPRSEFSEREYIYMLMEGMIMIVLRGNFGNDFC